MWMFAIGLPGVEGEASTGNGREGASTGSGGVTGPGQDPDSRLHSRLHGTAITSYLYVWNSQSYNKIEIKKIQIVGYTPDYSQQQETLMQYIRQPQDKNVLAMTQQLTLRHKTLLNIWFIC